MKPGEIWKDEDGAHWKVMDARLAVGDGFRVFLSPVLGKKVRIMDGARYLMTALQFHHDLSRDRMFQRTTEMLGWKRVG